ncbi:hypothetical protein [Micromonospora sonneratiae]|uniref:Uncharacterized protein n=1 Tax=Micromonospora sonneratiae TaxID=1184706 RepID=A0ABW3YRG8_9ACTN
MITEKPPQPRAPIRRRRLFGLVPLAVGALVLAPAGRPAQAAGTTSAPECLADLLGR